jgi:hypothetical protein
VKDAGAGRGDVETWTTTTCTAELPLERFRAKIQPVLVAPLHDGSEIAWGPRACCRGGGRWYVHITQDLVDRGCYGKTGPPPPRAPLGDLWLKSRRQREDRIRIPACPLDVRQCPLGHWPGAVDWRRVRQDQDDLSARVSRRLHVARKCSAVMSR